MIGRAGGHRAIALLVIGDAVLGGVFVAALVRPAAETPAPARVVTASSVPGPAAAAQPYVDGDPAPGSWRPSPTTDPTTVTTSPVSTTMPPATRPASDTGLSSEDATTTTTIPMITTTTKPATLPPSPPPSTGVVG